MNKQRRKDIEDIISKLADLEALKTEIYEAIETVKDEEQEYYDNMPEGLQGSDKGYAAEEAINNLDEAYSMIDDIDVESIQSSLEMAAE
jgi:hypothetical protein